MKQLLLKLSTFIRGPERGVGPDSRGESEEEALAHPA